MSACNSAAEVRARRPRLARLRVIQAGRRRVEHPSTLLQSSPAASINRDVYGPSFRFGLERVRTVRKHIEQVAQQELAGALERRDEREVDLRLAEERAGGARTAQLAAGGRVQSATELLSHQAWIERTEQDQATLASDLSREEQEVARRRNVLGNAARETKALDRLEARRRGEFDRAAARAEGHALDEVALNVFRGSAA
jgi:flagellar export protein FliJ